MTNSELKYYKNLKQKKFRDSESKFLIEGEHLIEECLRSKIYCNNLEKIFVESGFKNQTLLRKLSTEYDDANIATIDSKKMQQLAETVNSQGIVGVVSIPATRIEKPMVSSNEFIVALDRINDPGNLGTIIRTCHWFGVNKLLISKDSAEIYNSKVVRSSQGSIFHVNTFPDVDVSAKLDYYFKNNYEILLADQTGDKQFSDVKSTTRNMILVLGNEASGISKEILENKNYNKIRIKGRSNCESLNVAVAAGILISEIVKS